MRTKLFIITLSLVLTAIGVYALIYFYEVSSRIGDGQTGTSVGGDIVVISYFVTAAATVIGCWAAFRSRHCSASVRALPFTAAFVCAGAFIFWAWLHLTGVVVPYSGAMNQ